MFSKQERRKNKYYFGGTKVCKAEKVRKYFVNPKTESFRLVCKLHYLQFGFQIYRISRPQMFFGTGAFKNFTIFTGKRLCWSLFLIKIQASGLQFYQKKLQHRWFSVKFAKSWRASFLQNTCVAASGNVLWNVSLFIAHRNDESCRCVVRNGAPSLISFYCVCFGFFYLFLFFLFFLWILLLA